MGKGVDSTAQGLNLIPEFTMSSCDIVQTSWPLYASVFSFAEQALYDLSHRAVVEIKPVNR